jgi:hypothetical protein
MTPKLMMSDCGSAGLIDADCYQESAADPCCAVSDNTWVPPITFRGGHHPLRKVLYLITIEGGPKLKRPLQVEVSPAEDGAFQVSATMLDVVGAGDDLASATQDLCETITAYWEEFSVTPGHELSPDAAALFARLRSALG